MRKAAGQVSRISGNSMAPSIPDGVRVVARPVRHGEILIGRVVVLEAAEGMFVAHRVIDVGAGGEVICQGDNRRIRDKPIAPDRLVGVIEAVEGSSGKWLPLRRRGGIFISQLLRYCPHALRVVPDGLLTSLLVSASEQKRSRISGSMRKKFDIQKVGRECVVLDKETGDLHLLNETAAEIFQLIQKGHDKTAILGIFRQEFQIADENVLQSDIDAAIHDLLDLGLIEENQA